MGQNHEQDRHPATEYREREAPASALAAAESYVAGSTIASGEGYGGRTEFAVSFEALVGWGYDNKLIIPETEYPFLSRPPDGKGDEHEAWFDENSNPRRWFKATYENRFGLGWDGGESATPRHYLTRLVLQNLYFGDDIVLISIVDCRGRIRILTSQRHIAGEAATYPEITAWMLGLNFCRVEHKGCIAWYRALENLLVADVHEGNVIHSLGGELVPIDLNIIQPTGDLREWAIASSLSDPS